MSADVSIEANMENVCGPMRLQFTVAAVKITPPRSAKFRIPLLQPSDELRGDEIVDLKQTLRERADRGFTCAATTAR